MRRILKIAAIATVVYAVLAVLLVLLTRTRNETLWIYALTRLGPVAVFAAMIIGALAGLEGIGSASARWLALIAICGTLAGLSALLVFVLAVNVHLALGGQL